MIWYGLAYGVVWNGSGWFIRFAFRASLRSAVLCWVFIVLISLVESIRFWFGSVLVFDWIRFVSVQIRFRLVRVCSVRLIRSSHARFGLCVLSRVFASFPLASTGWRTCVPFTCLLPVGSPLQKWKSRQHIPS